MIDKARKLRCKNLASREAEMTHQADIEIAEYAKSGLPEDAVQLKVQYPNAVQRERYVRLSISQHQVADMNLKLYSSVRKGSSRPCDRDS